MNQYHNSNLWQHWSHFFFVFLFLLHFSFLSDEPMSKELQQSKSACFQPSWRATTNDILAKANASLSRPTTAAACSQSQQLGLQISALESNQPMSADYLILSADSPEEVQAPYRGCSRAIKKDFPSSVTSLNHTPIYEWYVVWCGFKNGCWVVCGFKNGCWNDMCLKVIGLCVQNMKTILDSTLT